MINLYVYSKRKKVLGFTFHLFDGDKYVVDHDTYKDTVDMDRYFESSKCDIIGINLERFISFCEEKMTSKTILIEEALSDLKKACQWRSKHREKYNEFIDLVYRGKSKMKDIVNALDGEDVIKSYMMYRVLINFIKKELDR